MNDPIFRPLAAILLTLMLAACSGTVDLGSIGRQLGGAPAATSAPSATAGATVTNGDQTQVEAVKQTIQRANDAQAQAVNSGDPSLMQATATADFYAQLVQTNRDLATSGVRKIALVSTEYQSISVDGANATATTLESWSTAYSDGSSDQATARNDYTLVLDSGTWKIATNDQPSAVLEPAPQPQTDTGTPAAASTAAISSRPGPKLP